jgi:hypothetical protein
MAPVLIPVPLRRPGVNAVLILEAYEEGGEIICGLRHLEGSIRLGPKALRSAVAEEVTKIEGIVAAHGCSEIRHAGRDWSKLLPGFEPDPDLENGLRKRLA